MGRKKEQLIKIRISQCQSEKRDIFAIFLEKPLVTTGIDVKRKFTNLTALKTIDKSYTQATSLHIVIKRDCSLYVVK